MSLPARLDAARRGLGRECLALVDAAHHWLAIAVIPGSVQERHRPGAPDGGKAAPPRLRA